VQRADTLSGPCAAGTAGAAAGTAETFTATGATGTAGAGAGPGTWSCVVLCCFCCLHFLKNAYC